jgi:cbb3-type cytochrome oxidase subunit 3
MGLILLEALAAGLVFILIIWWTMFSGRKKGELHDEDDADAGQDAAGKNPPPKP